MIKLPFVLRRTMDMKVAARLADHLSVQQAALNRHREIEKYQRDRIRELEQLWKVIKTDIGIEEVGDALPI